MAGPSRLVWFDANRVAAAFGVVLIHSTTDFAGQPFADVESGDRLLAVFFRSIGEFSGSEMFFLFSLFLMAMRVDKKRPEYSAAVGQQASRLLVPFLVWTVFYAFFRLIKAEAFGYSPYIWEQLGQWQSWIGYVLLGKTQYHMHFLPTLFLLFLFYPVMRLAGRYPILGVSVFATLGAMNAAQGYVWSLDLEPLTRDIILRAIKVWGYVGYGMVAFAIYGLWKDGIPRGESRLLRKGALYFAGMAYVATIPFYGYAVENGSWGIRGGWDFYGHFLMPIFMFCLFIGGQYENWSPRWSRAAKYSFGVYLVHPVVIDLFDVLLFKSGIAAYLDPWMIVISRYAIALPGSFLVAYGLSRIKLTAWTIGLGPAPWTWRSDAKAKVA